MVIHGDNWWLDMLVLNQLPWQLSQVGKLRRLGFLGLMSLQSRQAQTAARHSSFGYGSELRIIQVLKKRKVFGLTKHWNPVGNFDLCPVMFSASFLQVGLMTSTFAPAEVWQGMHGLHCWLEEYCQDMSRFFPEVRCRFAEACMLWLNNSGRWHSSSDLSRRPSWFEVRAAEASQHGTCFKGQMPRPLESRTRPKVGESQCSFSAILVHPKTCRDNQTIVMNQGIRGTLFSGKHVELVLRSEDVPKFASELPDNDLRCKLSHNAFRKPKSATARCRNLSSIVFEIARTCGDLRIFNSCQQRWTARWETCSWWPWYVGRYMQIRCDRLPTAFG